jgi:glycosyltransferase involved in cell wall biosynthesis
MLGSNLGGTEKVGLNFMEGLQDRGHQVRVVSLNPIGELGPLLADRHIPAEGLPYRGTIGWRSMGLMYRAFRSDPAEAVMMTGDNLAAMLALGNYCRERRLQCFHTYHEGRPEWQWRTIYRVALRQFRAVTYPCDLLRKEAEKIYPPIAAISHTVRNPIVVPDLPSPEERAAARARLGLPQTARIVGSASRLAEGKRIDVFLDVAREVLAAAPEAFFVIAGDGPLRSKFEEQARALEIANRVLWLGLQEDLRPFYSSLDVLHFNSDGEVLGLTPLEALAHGVPAVVSVLHSGLSEVVERDEHIFLTETHDTNWLAEKIVLILNHPEAGRRMALAGRKHLAQVCSPEKSVETVSRLLRLDGKASS